MPILATLMVGLFGQMASFFALHVTQKVAMATAAISAFGILTVAVLAALTAIVAGLSFSIPGQYMDMATWFLMTSPNLTAISACFAADAAVALYRWNVENLRLAAYIT